MYQPLVSIISPTYRHEGLIGSCIRSVLAQSYAAWELIVVDDASPDRTAEIVERFAAHDHRIRLVRHKSNYGPSRLSETYNEALAQCKGDLIAVLEGDDEWAAEKLSVQVEVFRDPQVVLCYSDYDQVTTDGLLIARHGIRDAAAQDRSGPRENLQFFSALKSFGAVTVMVRSDTLREIGGFGDAGVPFVDYPTWLMLATRGLFVRVPEVLATWRRHPASISYAYEYATIEHLERHFVDYLRKEHENLAAIGIEGAELALLTRNARLAARERQRSKSYYQGKYHLVFGERLKAIGPFFRALVDPSMAPRHRLGALAGIVAAATSPRLVPYLGRITRAFRSSR